MDPTNVSALLDKHGPMGAALLFVSCVFYIFVTRILPALIETQGKRLDGIVGGLSELIHLFTQRLDQQDQLDAQRHQEIRGKLDTIAGKIEELPQRISEQEHGRRD